MSETPATSAAAPVTADDVAREMIAAMRRGDQPGAEQALSSYLTRLPRDPASPGLDDPQAAATALRDLVMKVAEVAADEAVS